MRLGRLRWRLPGTSRVRFFNFGAKYLQNFSLCSTTRRREYRKFLLNLQLSWEWVFVRNSLIITYKVTKNIPFPQLF